MHWCEACVCPEVSPPASWRLAGGRSVGLTLKGPALVLGTFGSAVPEGTVQ